MKIGFIYAVLMIFVSHLLPAHAGFGQSLEQRITIGAKNENLIQLFTKIKQETGLSFVFPKEIKKTLVNFEAGERTVNEVLDLALKGTPFRYHVRGTRILVYQENADQKKKGDKLQDAQAYESMDGFYIVSGKVTEAGTQQPLPGVNIYIKNTTRGTTTDSEGKFFIDAEESEVLVFSFIGYKSTEMPVAGRATIDVEMLSDVLALKAVEVIGTTYWSNAKEKATSSIVKINSKDIEKQPVTTPLLALQGRVAGLDITPSTGAPGNAPKIRIRGNNSLRYNGSFPLYIIDGIPIDSKPLPSNNGSVMQGGFDPLNTINPANIESIEILKDGDATAIYGSRGANGVIIIKTKKNEADEGTNFDFGYYTGVGAVSNKVDLLSREQYLQMRKEAYLNDNQIPNSLTGYDLILWDTTRSTDWQEILLGGTSKITDIQGTFSGGSKNTSYRFGGSYHTETLILPSDFSYKRITGQLSLNHSTTNQKFKISVALNYGLDNNKLPGELSLVNLALSLPPIAPNLYDKNGNLNFQQRSNGTSTWTNPLSTLKREGKSTFSNWIASGTLSYELMPGIAIKSSFGFTEVSGNEIEKNPISAKAPELRSTRYGESIFDFSKRNSWMVEPQIQFNKTVKYHSLDVLLGTTFQEIKSSRQTIYASGYTSDASLENLSSATGYSISHQVTQYKYAALFCRAGYHYKDKYLVNLTGRRDGSSRFGPKSRFGNFGAVGIGWILTEEKLMQNHLSFLSFGKLRASFALTGNDQIGDYGYYNVYQTARSNYQEGTSLSPRALYNPNYAWEVTKKLEMAVELGFLDNRISVEANRYVNRSSNQLIDYQLPATAGFSSVTANFDATVENTGWEFMLNTINVNNEIFRWTLAFNLSLPKNRLLSFNDIENSSYSKIYKVGEPLSARYLYTFTGVDAANGYLTFLDKNDDGFINDRDQGIMKSLDKRYYGGLTNTFLYKGFEVSILLHFSSQHSTRFMPGAMPGYLVINQPVQVLNRWQNEGDNAQYARFSQNIFPNLIDYTKLIESDFNYDIASFIRLKTLAIAYAFPASFLKKTHLNSAKVFVQGQNLYTVTDYINLDPETGAALPPLRMITGGIQLKL